MKHAVTEHRLASGARGLVIDVPGSSVLNLEVRFNSGFSLGDMKHYELPHVLEHMLATVSQKYPQPNAFMIEAQKNGAYVNASTGVRANSYIYEFAPFELERMLDLVEEQIARPYFVTDRLAGEIGNVREELTRNTTQPGAQVSMALLAAAVPGQWLDYEARIAQLPKLNVTLLEAYYHRTHTSQNAFFSVAGDVGEGDQIVQRLEAAFRQLPQGKPIAWTSQRGRRLDEPVVRKMPIGQVYYRVARSLPELSLPQRRAMAVLRTALVGGMGSRILGKARERGWAYSVGGMFSSEPGSATAGFGGYVTKDHARDLFELMDQQLQNVAAHGLTNTELADTVRLMTGNWLRALQTPADVLGWYSEDYDEWGIIRDFDTEVAAIRDVSGQAVQEVAAYMLHEGRPAAAFVGDLSVAEAHDYALAMGKLY